MAKYVLLYESAPDGLAKAPALFPAHRERFEAFHADGTLLMIGTFADPIAHGAMALFTTHDAAEDFATGDPFVVEGVVGRWEIREWNEVLSGD